MFTDISDFSWKQVCEIHPSAGQPDSVTTTNGSANNNKGKKPQCALQKVMNKYSKQRDYSTLSSV
jgi:hypothetical protein